MINKKCYVDNNLSNEMYILSRQDDALIVLVNMEKNINEIHEIDLGFTQHGSSFAIIDIAKYKELLECLETCMIIDKNKHIQEQKTEEVHTVDINCSGLIYCTETYYDRNNQRSNTIVELLDKYIKHIEFAHISQLKKDEQIKTKLHYINECELMKTGIKLR